MVFFWILDFKIDFQRSIDGERVYLALIGKPLDGKYKIKGSPSKTKRMKVKKTLRKGPSVSATKFKVGTIKKGNDNLYLHLITDMVKLSNGKKNRMYISGHFFFFQFLIFY